MSTHFLRKFNFFHNFSRNAHVAFFVTSYLSLFFSKNIFPEKFCKQVFSDIFIYACIHFLSNQGEKTAYFLKTLYVFLCHLFCASRINGLFSLSCHFLRSFDFVFISHFVLHPQNPLFYLLFIISITQFLIIIILFFIFNHRFLPNTCRKIPIIPYITRITIMSFLFLL